METSNKLIGEQLSLWTSSAADIPVNHSASQDNAKEQKTQGTFGRTLEKSLNYYDRNTQSWRTWQATLVSDLDLYSETWPRSGTTRNGKSFQLVPLVLHIEETESSLLPTPTCKPIFHPQMPWDGVSRQLKRPGGLSFGLSIADVVGGQPNPMFLEWMMGFPIGWTELKH